MGQLTRADTAPPAPGPRLLLARQHRSVPALPAFLPHRRQDARRPPAVVSAHSRGGGARAGTARPGKAEK